jgi:hypothetical protein
MNVAWCIIFICGVITGACPPLAMNVILRRRFDRVKAHRDSMVRQRQAEMYVAERTSAPHPSAPPARISNVKRATESEVKFDYPNG